MANLIPFIPRIRKPNPVVNPKPQPRPPVDSTPSQKGDSATSPEFEPNMSTENGPVYSSPTGDVIIPRIRGGGSDGGGSPTPSDVGGDQLNYSDDVNIERDRVERNNNPPNPPTNTAPTNIPNNSNKPNNNPPIYYSNNPNFKPKDPRGVVVYLNKGKTTGYTNTGIFLPEGVAVSRLGKKDFSNIREEVGKVTRDYPDVYSLNQSYDANISLASGGVGYVSTTVVSENKPIVNALSSESSNIQQPKETRLNKIKQSFKRANDWLERRFPRGGEELPFKLQSTPERVKGEEFSILYSNRYIANKITNKLPEGFVNSTNEKITTIPFASPILKGSEEFTTGAVQFTLFAPTMIDTRASSDFQESTFRTRQLAPKQAPRSSGIDVKPVQDGFVFKEKITVPRRYEYINTPLREYFDIEDTKVTYTKPRVFEQKSLNIIRFDGEGNIQQPAGVELKEVTQGSPTTIKYYQLDGSARLQPLNEIRASNNVEQAQLRNLFKSVNQKVRYQDTYFTKPNQETFVSNIRAKEIARARIKASEGRINVLVKNPPLGKTTSSNTVVGIQEPVIKANGVDIYQYKFVSRDTTFPTTKPRTFPETSGVSVIPNKPLIEETSSGGNTIIKVSKSKTPRAEIISKQISQTVSKNIPKVNPVSKPNNVVANIETNIIKPSPVSNINAKSIQTTTQQESGRIINELKPSSLNINSELTRQKEIEINVGKTITELKNNERLIPKSSPRLKQNDVSVPKEQQVEKQIQRNGLATQTRLEQKTSLRNIFTRLRGQTDVKPINPKPIIRKSNSKVVSSPKLSEAFDVVTYKGGKEVTIARGLPEGLAKKRGVKEVLGTLRASFKLKESQLKTTLPDINYNLPRGFTVSKKDPERFVQVLNTRIKTRPEVFEAKSLKRSSKKIKWF